MSGYDIKHKFYRKNDYVCVVQICLKISSEFYEKFKLVADFTEIDSFGYKEYFISKEDFRICIKEKSFNFFKVLNDGKMLTIVLDSSIVDNHCKIDNTTINNFKDFIKKLNIFKMILDEVDKIKLEDF
jgi:hypothetical protein